jgi:hypothetical protein
VPIRITLIELGHKQPATSLRTDNSTAFGIFNETIKQKRSKSMDMRYRWLTDRVCQKQFYVYWRPGRDIMGYYHTQNNSAQHHKDMRILILHQANILHFMQGCVRLLPLPLPQPQPRTRTRTDAHTFQSTQRATQLRGVLARTYSVTLQNMNTVSTTTVPYF